MRVILLRDVRGLGRKNDVKEVSDGYARNFLIAKKMASPATAEAVSAQKELMNREAGEMYKLIAAAKALSEKTIEFRVKAGEKGEVFGSVTREDVRGELERMGYKNIEVELHKPIKTLGEHPVDVNFGKGVKGQAKIILVPDK